jgi:hypothetical protein
MKVPPQVTQGALVEVLWEELDKSSSRAAESFAKDMPVKVVKMEGDGDVQVEEVTETDDAGSGERKTLFLKRGEYLEPKPMRKTLEDLEREADALARTVQDKKKGKGSGAVNFMSKAALPVKFLASGVKMIPVVAQIAGPLSKVGWS